MIAAPDGRPGQRGVPCCHRVDRGPGRHDRRGSRSTRARDQPRGLSGIETRPGAPIDWRRPCFGTWRSSPARARWRRARVGLGDSTHPIRSSAPDAASAATDAVDALPRPRRARVVMRRCSSPAATRSRQPMTTLTREERRAFAVGNNFFNDNWVTAPASTEGRDGLGPVVQRPVVLVVPRVQDGRGAPPLAADDPERGLLLRLSVSGPDGKPDPDPVLRRATAGPVDQRRAGRGPHRDRRTEVARHLCATGRPTRCSPRRTSIEDLGIRPARRRRSMISPRVAPAVFGVGLLEAVPDDDVLAAADPDDADGDGISGRVNHVLDASGEMVLGRFGWKANVATVEPAERQRVPRRHRDHHPRCTRCRSAPRPQTECTAAIDGGSPEIDDQKLERVDVLHANARRARAARRRPTPRPCRARRCSHDSAARRATLRRCSTGDSDIAALADQTIRPYTDLLLHDMGPGLADDRPDGEATRQRVAHRTAVGHRPGRDVNGHTRFLHDGRARDLEEAMLWHGGEAAAAQDRFLQLDAVGRATNCSRSWTRCETTRCSTRGRRRRLGVHWRRFGHGRRLAEPRGRRRGDHHRRDPAGLRAACRGDGRAVRGTGRPVRASRRRSARGRPTGMA